MDALRRQQINNILNYDRNMNLRALALERKQGALMGPDGGKTGAIINQDVIDMAHDAVNSLFVLLDQRRADINTTTRWHYRGRDRVYGDAVSNLGRISEVVGAYNQLVSTYLSNHTTQTKDIMLSSIRRMFGFVSEIRRGANNHMQHNLRFNLRTTHSAH